MIKIIFIAIFVFVVSCIRKENADIFVFLEEIDPTIIQSVRYSSNENFLGRVPEGYGIKKIISTKSAALRLKQVNDELKRMGYTLVVYDAYRPQRAVDDFVKWSQDLKDQKKKDYYYPYVNKENAFDLGYIARKSGHTRGSTFDLTIIENNKQLHEVVASKRSLSDGRSITFLDDGTVDMGSSFDLFDEASHHNTSLVSKNALQMRNMLKDVMTKHGFKAYVKEWWHYTLKSEPYPDTYFDFVIE